MESTCHWCGNNFRAAGETSTALYCCRTHKTSAEKLRRRWRDTTPGRCEHPEFASEPVRGLAIAEARRVRGRSHECACGTFHVIPPTDGAELVHFADDTLALVDHTGTPIDLFDPDRHRKEVTSMHEPGPDGASHSALDELMWGSGDPSALA